MAGTPFTPMPHRAYTPLAGVKISRLVLDDETPQADPLFGTQIGPCEVFSRLVHGEARTLLAFRMHEEGNSVVVMRQLDDGQATPEVIAEAQGAAKLQDRN